MKGVRTAMLALVAGSTFPACAEFSSDGMSGGLGSSAGTTSGTDGDSSSSTSGDSMAGVATDAPMTSTVDPDDGSSGEADTQDPTSVDSTGAEETTGPLTGFQDGTYEGVLSIEMESSFGDYTCVGEITLTVAEDDEQQVAGEGSCSVQLPFGAVVGDIVVSGALALPIADGQATLTTELDSDEATWNGGFAGETFTGTFNGVYTLSGYQVNYVGSWAADR